MAQGNRPMTVAPYGRWASHAGLLLFAVLLLSSTAVGQDESGEVPAEKNAPVDAAEKAEHDALRALRVTFEKAINENDLTLIKPHFDDDYSVVTYTDTEFTDFEVFQTAWQKSREKFLETSRLILARLYVFCTSGGKWPKVTY